MNCCNVTDKNESVELCRGTRTAQRQTPTQIPIGSVLSYQYLSLCLSHFRKSEASAQITINARKHSSRMRTARFCSSGRVGYPGQGYTLPPAYPPWIPYPGYPTPWIPYPKIPYPPDTPPLWIPYPSPERTWDQEGTWHQRCPPPVNRLTDACDNITFPQLLSRAVMTSMFFPQKRGATV